MLRIALVAVAACALVFFVVASYYYFKYQAHCGRAAEGAAVCQHRQDLCGAARGAAGQKLNVRLLADELREAGYTADGASQASQLGTYSEGVQAITVRPGPQSYHSQDAATIHVSGGVVSRSPTITGSRCPAMNWSRC